MLGGASPLSRSAPWLTCARCVLSAEFLHVKPGKGAAFVRTKLRNFISGNQVDKTFRAGETVEAAEIDKRGAQFTYQDGNDVSTPLSFHNCCRCEAELFLYSVHQVPE